MDNWFCMIDIDYFNFNSISMTNKLILFTGISEWKILNTALIQYIL